MAERSEEVTFECMNVTPKIAAQLLKTNINNRPLSPNTVRNYAGDMKRGEWIRNGETIKVDGDDRLVDGQHRLAAVELADMTVEMDFAFNVPKSAFKTIDAGKTRNAGDMVAIEAARLVGAKIKNPTATASALRTLYFYKTPGWQINKAGRLGRMTNTQIVGHIAEHKDFFEPALQAMRLPIYCGLVPHSQNMFVWYITSKIDKDLAREFFLQLSNREDIRVVDTTSAKQLREMLKKVSEEVFPPPAYVKLAWLITAFNKFLASRAHGQFKRRIQSMPRFDREPKQVRAK